MNIRQTFVHMVLGDLRERQRPHYDECGLFVLYQNEDEEDGSSVEYRCEKCSVGLWVQTSIEA